MVGNLSPEPPSNIEDQITQADRDHVDLIVQDSDEESVEEDNGYQLLSQDEQETQLPMEEDEDSQVAEIPADSLHSEEALKETISIYSETRSSDIQIDADQIRSVMANINLPSSSIPAWAQAVSEAQLSSLVHDRIARSQQR